MKQSKYNGIDSVLKRLKHVDELLGMPEYLEKKRLLLLASHIVSANGCWEWTKYTDKEGRGGCSVGYVYTNAARVSYVVFKREPVGDLQVCHSCDNPLCVNPNHLWLGTLTDNIKDMWAKGRNSNRKGENSYVSKLKEEDIVAIKELRLMGNTLRNIGGRYKVSEAQISRICKGKSWSHVK